MTSAAEHAAWTWRDAFIAFGCCLVLTLIAFGRSLWQDFSPIDDGYLILQNLAVRGPTWEHLKTIFTTYDPELYIPLTLFSFQSDYLVAGLSPAMFHATNLLLHTLNAMLVAWLLLQLTGRKGLALFAALLFAVHPLHTEAVVWAAGRKDVLSTFFYLLALLSYILYRDISLMRQRRQTRHMMEGTATPLSPLSRLSPAYPVYVLSLALFALALLSKAMALTLPAVLILLDLLIDRRKIDARFFVDKIPYVILSVIFFVVAAAGKERILASSTLWETALMAGKSTLFYLTKFLFPFGLTVYYPHNGPIGISDPQFLWPAIVVVILASFTIWAWKRWPRIAFGLLFFAVTLSPTFFNFHKGELLFFAVDRYAYLPSVGLLFLVCLFVLWLREKDLHEGLLQLIGAALLVGAVSLSIVQTRFWDGPEQLFARALKLYPESLPARLDLADTMLGQGRTQESFALLQEGLKHSQHPQLYMAAGFTYARVGQLDEARAQFARAKELAPQNPEPLFALGSLEEQSGKLDAALPLYTQAVAMDESYVGARLGIARLALAKNDLAAAEIQLAEALRWNSNSIDGHVLAAQFALKQKRSDDAAMHLDLALQLDPTNAEAKRLQTMLKEEK